MESKKTNIIVCVVLIFSIVELAFLAFLFTYNRNFDRSEKPLLASKTGKNFVSCRLLTTASPNTHIQAVFRIPYKDTRHKQDLRKNFPRIKNDMIMYLDPVRMLEKGGAEDLKKEATKIVNKYSKIPIESVLLEKYNVY
jgi:flagellar basal body-associated protein FliL